MTESCARNVKRLLAAIVCALAYASAPAASAAARIVVAQGAATPRLESVLAALRTHTTLPVHAVSLPDQGMDALRNDWSRSDKGSVLVALGPSASDAIARVSLSGPIVHCLAGPDALRAGSPSVPSEVPVDQQAAWLAKLAPATKTVGLLFDPAHNTRRAEAYAAALGVAGYRTLMQAVTSPAGLPAALDSVAGRADVLLALRDGTVYANEAARGLLLYSFRKRIPIVGTSEAWVKRGALYALDWDYAEVGAACAALVAREVGGRAGASPIAPRPRVYVNLKSAQHFGIDWSADVLRQVDVRHE